jgi:hypothetical protein
MLGKGFKIYYMCVYIDGVFQQQRSLVGRVSISHFPKQKKGKGKTGREEGIKIWDRDLVLSPSVSSLLNY